MKRLAVAAGALAVPTLLLGTVVMTAGSAQDGALLAAGAPNVAACVPDARLAPPGPSAGRTAGLSGGQVARAAYAAGWRGGDLVVAVAVAKAESTWNPTARNENANGSTDLGLFQINTIHAAILATGDPMDPTDNARMAFQVWTDAGERWGPWVAYWTGSYKQYLAEAKTAVSGVADVAASITGCTRDLVAAGGLSDPGPGPQASNGYTPRAENVRALTRTRWGCRVRAQPCITDIYGYAKRMIAGTGTPSDHASGNAADIMLPGDYRAAAQQALGVEIAEFWVANAKATGVKYVIFNKRIWTVTRDRDPKPFAQWRPYCHPGGGCDGGDTLMHVDHVHVSVRS